MPRRAWPAHVSIRSKRRVLALATADESLARFINSFLRIGAQTVGSVTDVTEKGAQTLSRHGDRLAGEPPRLFANAARG